MVGSRLIGALVCNVSPLDASGLVFIKGTGTHTIPETGYSVSVGGNGHYFTFSSSTLVPMSVTAQRNVSITWQVRQDGSSSWTTLGISTNTVYVTLDTPFASGLPYHSVMEIACGTSGATTQSQVFTDIWNRFASRNVKRVDMQELFYYRPPDTDFASNKTDVTGLLYDKTGQCGAWVDFMSHCLFMHNNTGSSGWIDTEVTDSNQNALDRNLVIKSWQQDNTGTQTVPYKWRIKSSRLDYIDLVPRPAGNDYGDLTQLSGLIAQQNRTPSEKVFVRHWIIKNGNTYYDPSYGTTYTSRDNMELNAVYGFTEPTIFDGVNLWADVRLSSGAGGVLFSN